MKRFIDIYVPTEVCNLKCTYCYVAQMGRARNTICNIGHSPEEVRRALSVERMGGICFFNFCGGGETLLGNEILPIIKAVLEEGHYVQIVTNGTVSEKFKEMALWDRNILKRIFFKFSFHFLELKRLNLTNIFFINVNLMKNAGCSFTLELMPHDELVPYIDEIKAVCLENVYALPHLTVGRDDRTAEFKLLSKYSFEQYKKIWDTFQSDMFEFKMEMFGEERREYCYAGEWSCSLRIDTGDMFQCNGCVKIDNIYQSDKPLKFIPVGYECPHAHCYNCHAYITMGVFPDIEAPVYAKMRDRKCLDGSSWLSPEVADFFSQKLKDNNVAYKEN